MNRALYEEFKLYLDATKAKIDEQAKVIQERANEQAKETQIALEWIQSRLMFLDRRFRPAERYRHPRRKYKVRKAKG